MYSIPGWQVDADDPVVKMGGPWPIKPPDFEIEKYGTFTSIRYGEMSNQGYEAGEKNQSEIYRVDPSSRDVYVQSYSKMAEWVACKFFGLNPLGELGFDRGPDWGWDFIKEFSKRKVLIDVKSSVWERFFWPHTRNDRLWLPTGPHVLIGARLVGIETHPDKRVVSDLYKAKIRLFGWCSRRRFCREHRIAGCDDPSRLQPGTRYLPVEYLPPLSDLESLERMARREGRYYEFVNGNDPTSWMLPDALCPRR